METQYLLRRGDCGKVYGLIWQSCITLKRLQRFFVIS